MRYCARAGFLFVPTAARGAGSSLCPTVWVGGVGRGWGVLLAGSATGAAFYSCTERQAGHDGEGLREMMAGTETHLVLFAAVAF